MTCCITVSEPVFLSVKRLAERIIMGQGKISAWQFVSSWNFHHLESSSFLRRQGSLHVGFCENLVSRWTRRSHR